MTIKEIFILSISRNVEFRAKLSDTILKEGHLRSIQAKSGLIWFSYFKGEDLNIIFYQNMRNLHNWYKSAKRKTSQKKPEYMLNYSSVIAM